MASIRRTVARAIDRNPNAWRSANYKYGENRTERRRRAKVTAADQKKQKK